MSRLGEMVTLLSNGGVPLAVASALGVVPVLAYLSHLWHRRPAAKGKVPPGDLGSPIIGEMRAFFGEGGPLEFSMERARKFGTPFLTHLFFSPTIELSEDDDARALWEMERKGVVAKTIPGHIRRLMGRGTVNTAAGARHRALRRLVGPAFAPSSVRDYVDVVDRTTRAQLEKWASSGGFHSSFEFKELALRLLFTCVFPSVGEEVLQRVHKDIGVWLAGFHALPFALPGFAFSKGLDARKRLIDLIGDLVGDFMKEHSSESEEARTTLLGRLCYGKDEEGKQLNTEDLSNNILLIFFAGHDTTYATLGSLLHNVSSDQKVADALIEEVSADKFQGPVLDFDELKNAPILNAVLAESWRKDPPVLVTGARTALKDVALKQWHIPKGFKLQYNVGLCAYDEKRYPNPSEFKIERFLPADHSFNGEVGLNAGVDYNGPAFPVFGGGGSHNCLGSHFARLEARVILLRMFQLYDVEVRNGKKVKFPFNTHQTELKLTPRKYSDQIHAVTGKTRVPSDQ